MEPGTEKFLIAMQNLASHYMPLPEMVQEAMFAQINPLVDSSILDGFHDRVNALRAKPYAGLTFDQAKELAEEIGEICWAMLWKEYELREAEIDRLKQRIKSLE